MSNDISLATGEGSMPIGMQIMFNDKLFDRCKQMAGYLAKAKGITPPHLIGQSEACFAVVTRSLTWKMDPYAVAQSTYATPGGKVGYEGKLVQAILENSGHLEGPVTYELIGDWTKVQGKFAIKKSQKGRDFAAATYTAKDEEGLGVIVRAQVKGEAEPRELVFMLREAFPRNSTLWATRPSQQIKYTAVRAFANTAAPGLFMGVPFSTDTSDGSGMVDVTPAKPDRSSSDQSEGVQTIEMNAEDKAPYVIGREAYIAGNPLQDVSCFVNAEVHQDWTRGWKEAQAEENNSNPETGEIAEEKTKPEPETKQEKPSTKEELEAAYSAGQEAFAQNRRQESGPREPKDIADEWVQGFVDAEIDQQGRIED